MENMLEIDLLKYKKVIGEKEVLQIMKMMKSPQFIKNLIRRNLKKLNLNFLHLYDKIY